MIRLMVSSLTTFRFVWILYVASPICAWCYSARTGATIYKSRPSMMLCTPCHHPLWLCCFIICAASLQMSASLELDFVACGLLYISQAIWLYQYNRALWILQHMRATNSLLCSHPCRCTWATQSPTATSAPTRRLKRKTPENQ